MTTPVAPLFERASSTRHPVIRHAVVIPVSGADPAGVVHAGAAHPTDATRSAGGGAARNQHDAREAATAEAIERMVASHAQVEVRLASTIASHRRVDLAAWSLHSGTQLARDDFPHRRAYQDDPFLSQMYEVDSTEPWWVPAALVSLSDGYGALATSSGLAAAPTVAAAALRAVQELVERDAFVATWLHQLSGRRVAAPELDDEVARSGGSIVAVDLTPSFSPHPVAAVLGTFPMRGHARHSLGIACRAGWAEAVDKAFLECCQGVVFAAHHLCLHPELGRLEPAAVTDFDRHAVYYTARSHRWPALPIFADPTVHGPPPDAPSAATATAGDDRFGLTELVAALARGGVRVLVRELTTVEANQMGVRVVRAASPELTPIHHDHRWPHLGGRTADIAWRYPDAADRVAGRQFPSPHPHPLG